MRFSLCALLLTSAGIAQVSFTPGINITRDELKAAIDAAHARGLTLTGHLCSVGFHEAAAMGIDNLEHGIVTDVEYLPGKKPDVCAPGPTAAQLAESPRAASRTSRR